MFCSKVVAFFGSYNFAIKKSFISSSHNLCSRNGLEKHRLFTILHLTHRNLNSTLSYRNVCLEMNFQNDNYNLYSIAMQYGRLRSSSAFNIHNFKKRASTRLSCLNVSKTTKNLSNFKNPEKLFWGIELNAVLKIKFGGATVIWWKTQNFRYLKGSDIDDRHIRKEIKYSTDSFLSLRPTECLSI